MEHSQYLLQALALASERLGFCSPNPSVGALVVQNNAVISRAYHYAAGHPHAEVIACQNLPDNLRDHTLYVTLEPCCHHGRTPPCTEFIVSKGIKKVIYSYQDPNPKVAGKGEKYLQQQGVDCQQITVPEIQEFYKEYTYWTQTQKPFITCKLALSLDGKIAQANGDPIAITGKVVNKFTHQWRKKTDAILTSAQTILKDDPALNVRLEGETTAKPLFILDSSLSLPLSANIFNTAGKITVFYSVAPPHKIETLRQLGVDCQQVAMTDNKLDLNDVIKKIGQLGIHHLWVEAGGKVFNSFLSERLVQRGFVYVAPKFLGNSAYSVFNNGINLLTDVSNFKWHTDMGHDAVCEINWV